MVEETNSGSINATIPLEVELTCVIRQLYLEVLAPTQVHVVWSRGQKQAKTQKRVVNKSVPRANFDESFSMKTKLDVAADTLKPVKEKRSNLSVIAQTPAGQRIIGSATLDICSYKENDFNEIQLDLIDKETGDKIPNTYIEIGLKGLISEETIKNAQKSARSSKNLSAGLQDATLTGNLKKDRVRQLQEKLELLKKEVDQQQKEQEQKLKNQQEQIEQLKEQVKEDEAVLAQKQEQMRSQKVELENVERSSFQIKERISFRQTESVDEMGINFPSQSFYMNKAPNIVQAKRTHAYIFDIDNYTANYLKEAWDFPNY